MTAKEQLREIVQHILIEEGFGYAQRIDALERKVETQNKIIKALAQMVKGKK